MSIEEIDLRKEKLKDLSNKFNIKNNWYKVFQPVLFNVISLLLIISFVLSLVNNENIVTVILLVVLVVQNILIFFNITPNTYNKIIPYSNSLLTIYLIVSVLLNSINLITLINVLILLLVLIISIVTIIGNIKKHNQVVTIKNVNYRYKRFLLHTHFWFKRHNKITEFIMYFMVGNFVTIIQFILLPVFQLIFKNTNLLNIDFRLFGPIGAADKITTLESGLKVFDPYYVFNFTAGPVGSSVERTLNGITGNYLSRGGLAFFLAMFLTLVIAQVITFYMQRKVVFKSDSNLTKAIVWFVIATIVITIGQNALYGLYQPWIYTTFGDSIGGLVASFVQALISFWVFFPIFKIIFKQEKAN